MQLLENLCSIHAPSGNERALKDYILEYVRKNVNRWKVKPSVIEGPEFQDCILLKFGKPRTMALAHMDSVGFTVRYQDQLIPIGSPDAQAGYQLTGRDELGPIACTLKINKNHQ